MIVRLILWLSVLWIAPLVAMIMSHEHSNKDLSEI